jgi:PPOX class probable F420-dependent enzyme
LPHEYDWYAGDAPSHRGRDGGAAGDGSSRWPAAATEDALYFAVDQKPKRSATLQRLRNIDANPAVSVLIDHYEDDWTRLWWVRVDGRARIVRDGAELEAAINLLSRRYLQYRSTRPVGPAVVIEIERMTGWSAS